MFWQQHEEPLAARRCSRGRSLGYFGIAAEYDCEIVAPVRPTETRGGPQSLLFRRLTSVLAPGGLLLVTVPAESHTPAHMHAFNSAEDLCGMVEQAGLTALSVERNGTLAMETTGSTYFPCSKPGGKAW
jgi:hypothetical protein